MAFTKAYGATRLAGLAATLLAWAGGGCSPTPQTEIVVVTSTNLARGVVLRSVQVVAQRVGAASPLLDRPFDLTDGGLPLPGSVVLVAKDPDDDRALTVRVIGDLGGGRTLRQEAVVRFQRERTLYLHMTLASDCVDRGPPCGAGLTCRLGACERPDQAVLTGSPPAMTLQSDGGADVPGDLGDAGTTGDRAEADATDVPPAVDAPPVDDVASVVDVTDSALDVDDAGAMTDASLDVAMDAGTDVVTDAPRDAGADVAFDGGADVPRDVATDVPPDRVDVADASDAGVADVGEPDAGPCPTGIALDAGGCLAVPPPRPVAPLSTATVTSRRPTLRWALGGPANGARVEICADRACGNIERTVDAPGATGAPRLSAAPDADLSTGVHFWRLRGMVDGVVAASSGPVWQFVVGARSAPVDTSWGSVPDFNGDGYADVAISAVAPPDNVVFVFRGGASGVLPGPTRIADPGAAPAGFGRSLRCVGDVDGDGFADLAVADSQAMSMRGMVYIFRGGPQGVVTTSPTVLTGPLAGGYFGVSVSGAGDINRDGFGDVVVGASLAEGQQGRAYLYLGAPGGLVTNSPVTLLSPSGGANRFGASVSGVGDVNGDGFGDVAVSQGEALSVRSVFVYAGSASGIAATATPTVVSGYPRSAATLGGPGDFDGDGYADLTLGLYEANNDLGQVRVSGAGRRAS